jgi:hypothetical protein
MFRDFVYDRHLSSFHEYDRDKYSPKKPEKPKSETETEAKEIEPPSDESVINIIQDFSLGSTALSDREKDLMEQIEITFRKKVELILKLRNDK